MWHAGVSWGSSARAGTSRLVWHREVTSLIKWIIEQSSVSCCFRSSEEDLSWKWNNVGELISGLRYIIVNVRVNSFCKLCLKFRVQRPSQTATKRAERCVSPLDPPEVCGEYLLPSVHLPPDHHRHHPGHHWAGDWLLLEPSFHFTQVREREKYYIFMILFLILGTLT